MLEESFEKLYLNFRANYYKRMVQLIGAREGSLTATEQYCVEIIYLLGEPTVSEFAKFLNISVSNANYKINSLVEKGYVHKVPSKSDKREYHLAVTEKFLNYYGLNNQDNAHLVAQIHKHFTPEEVDRLDRDIQRILTFMNQTEEKEHD
ncbi:MAG: MarR family winged helix-turn-helix transcriptional regulator [Christensenellales bacterium]|jgi:DNA-binding MarR family transcriptional regulator